MTIIETQIQKLQKQPPFYDVEAIDRELAATFEDLKCKTQGGALPGDALPGDALPGGDLLNDLAGEVEEEVEEGVDQAK